MTNPAIPILRAAMKQRNLTVTGVSLRSGLSRSTVSRLLNGKQRFRWQHWMNLRFVLGDDAVNDAADANIEYALDKARKELT